MIDDAHERRAELRELSDVYLLAVDVTRASSCSARTAAAANLRIRGACVTSLHQVRTTLIDGDRMSDIAISPIQGRAAIDVGKKPGMTIGQSAPAARFLAGAGRATRKFPRF